jgi:hypothetical protein
MVILQCWANGREKCNACSSYTCQYLIADQPRYLSTYSTYMYEMKEYNLWSISFITAKDWGRFPKLPVVMVHVRVPICQCTQGDALNVFLLTCGCVV